VGTYGGINLDSYFCLAPVLLVRPNNSPSSERRRWLGAARRELQWNLDPMATDPRSHGRGIIVAPSPP